MRGQVAKHSLPKSHTPKKIFNLKVLRGYESIDCQEGSQLGSQIRNYQKEIFKGKARGKRVRKNKEFDLCSYEGAEGQIGKKESGGVKKKALRKAVTGGNDNEMIDQNLFLLDNRLHCEF